MQLMRCFRPLVSIAIFGLAGSFFGCSGGSNPAPPTKEDEKKIAADMKAARQEAKAAKGQMKGGGRR